jgi:pyruvate dehydrogenase E2 component (dihydrolipoamide acetyltransferase)
MATQVPIPKLGQSEETVSIVKWHKAEGDTVAKGDVLFEVETDKAVLEVESQFEGTLLKVVIPEGKEVPVMSIAAVLGDPGEDIPAIEQPKPATAEKPVEKSAPAPAKKPGIETKKTTPAPAQPTAPVATHQPAPVAPAPQPAKPDWHPVSPRAKKFAKDYLIDLDQVTGTGPNGRVVERDVMAYLDEIDYASHKITPTAKSMAQQIGLPITELQATGKSGRITVADVKKAEAQQPKPMSKMRQVIARRLQQSKQQIPHFYVTVSVDMTDLSAYRKTLKKSGFTLSFNDFILKASALTLAEFPDVNSVVSDDNQTVRWSADINVGMAVSVDQGLVVPVIRDTDKLDMDELHDVARELATKARDGKLTPDEMKGGTFTVSNMGMLQVDEFSAIINPGESAILAVSGIFPTPIVDDDRNIVVRDMMKITLSADHRVVDGAMAAQFCRAIKSKLENLELWQSQTGIK